MVDSSYAVFASPTFDANEYANAILSGEAVTGDGRQSTTARIAKAPSAQSGLIEPPKEDLSVAISKLSIGLEDVSKQLKGTVTAHHEALLVQVAGVSVLEDALRTVRAGLDEVSASQDKLRQKIHVPCIALEVHAKRLARLQRAADALRRTSRFVVVARRLEAQMAEVQRASLDADAKPNVNGQRGTVSRKDSGRGLVTAEDLLEGDKERAIAKAALSVAELVALLDASVESSYANDSIAETSGGADDDEMYSASVIPLRAIRAVAGHIPTVEAARDRITEEMESMVMSGLATLNRSLLASSLQTAHNLCVLPNLVQSLVLDLTDAVEQRIKVAFDMTQISNAVAAKEPTPTSHGLLYKSRIRTEPTNATAPQWTTVLWSRLESLVEEMAGCCIKVYTLEKVLQQKRDTVSQTNFMDEAMKLLENKPSSSFWSVLARTLEKQCRDAARGSTFLQQTLSKDYPRLLRLFHEFFAKIAVHTDTTYTQDKQSPETILVVRSLATFESLYLQRSANRLNEVVTQALAGGARTPPALGEGVDIARAAVNELDAARFDPMLLRGVARNVKAGLELLLTRMEPLIVRDRWATNLLGPVATPQQATNAQLAACLYHCWARLDKLRSEFPDGVVSTLDPTIRDIHRAYERIVDPLLSAIRRELSAIIARLHRLNLGKGSDAAISFGGGPSSYMKDLAEKLSFVKSEVLSKFNVGDVSREWVATIVRDVLRCFVLHASIVKPIGESGKLQLTSDMTELEFALSAFLVNGLSRGGRGASLDIIGDEYRALRAMRPLLFLENSMLSSPERTAGLPPLIVLHHILVRSPIPLPHALHGWNEAEYVRWVDEHSDEEALTLVEGVLQHWEKVPDRPAADFEASKEYLELAYAVLATATQRS